jgi:hypothetical protein
MLSARWVQTGTPYAIRGLRKSTTRPEGAWPIRYDKLAANSLAIIQLAANGLWL